MDSNNKRIAKNTVFLYIRMFFALIVTLYTSRVILRTLGVNDYGIYNVVAGFVSMFGFFNATLSSSMQRYYNYESAKNGENGYFEVYRTGLTIHILLGIILFILLETLGLWYVNTIMVIPEGRLFAANVVFQTTILSMLLLVLQIPYLGAIMATERMNYYALISIIDVLLKLAAVLVLPLIAFDNLIVYSILILIVSFADFLCYFIYAKSKILKFRINPFISFRKGFNKVLFKSILGFSGWNLLGTFAYLLKGQGLNMLLNVFWGPVVNAARGIAMQVNGGISGITGSIPIAFRPQIVNTFASDEKERCQHLMFVESKICYCLILFLIAPVIFEIDYILQLWLGCVVPENTGFFTSLVLIDSLICTFNTPLTQVAFATGNIKGYQIFSTCVNLLLLPTSYILLRIGFEAQSVFIATIIFSFLNNIVCVYSLKRIFVFSFRKYLNDVIFPCLFMTLLLPIVPFIIKNLLVVGFSRLIYECLSVCIVGVPVIFFVIFSKTERQYFLQITKSYRRCPK